MPSLAAATTVLVLIDLQNGIVGRPVEPASGPAVVDAAKRLAQRFRDAGALVVIVNVGWSADFGEALRQPVDRPTPRPPGGLPADWSEPVEGLVQPGDIRVTKHQWGAFYGTDLDVQLRRRGMQTVVIGGIATNMGVESTARQAYERGYAVVVPTDATASLSAQMHTFCVDTILPLIARVTTVDAIDLQG